MKGRRKRSKSNQCDTEELRRSIAPGSEAGSGANFAVDVQQQTNADISGFEAGSFASRSSVRLIHEVVSKFDRAKCDLVKNIGFGGVLSFPPIKQFNRKFCHWLMSCVNESPLSLDVSQNIQIPFNKHDVGLVFGIASSGKRVIDVHADCREAKDRVVHNYLGVEFKEHRSIKIAQGIVEREYCSPMSKQDAERFCVAFVVFVVSNLLAPSAKFDYASIDYWNVLQDPDSISTYDWSDYVITRLVDGVCKLKQDISNNLKFPSISGCSLFLQVLYLDSIQLDGLSIPHNSFPRVRHFPYDVLRRMIAADRNFMRYSRSDRLIIPASVMRDPSECCYSWADVASSESEESTDCSMFAIWEAAVAMVHLLNIPIEAAGPLFVAAADFQNQINSGLVVSGVQAIKFMSVLVSLMSPYVRGYRYQYAYGRTGAKSDFGMMDTAIRNGIRLLSGPIWKKVKDNSGALGWLCAGMRNQNDTAISDNRGSCTVDSGPARGGRLLEPSTSALHFQRSHRSVVTSLDGSPHFMNVNLRVATSMGQFYSLMRRIKPVCDFDLNASASDSVSSSSSSPVSFGSEYEALPSPWQLDYYWSTNDVNREMEYRKIDAIKHDESMAIIHRHPKYIQVACCDLWAQFNGSCEMEVDLFDALIRVVRQEDDALYRSFGHSRWRYFFESDFTEVIMCGSIDLLDPKLSEHLFPTSSVIDLSTAKIVFFPALLQFHWICFAWQPSENLISAFAPCSGPSLSESRLEAIQRCGYLLKVALTTLSRTVFKGLPEDIISAEIRVVNLADCSHPRFNRSGVLCSYFCRCFDGIDVTPPMSKVDEDLVAAKLISEIMSLKENSGRLMSID